MKSNLVTRALTGVIFVAVMVGSIIGGKISFGLLFLLITLLAVREFCHLANKYEKGVNVNTPLCMLGGGFLFASFYLNALMPGIQSAFIPYLIVLLGIMVSELYYKMPNPAANWAWAIMSQVYVALPFSLINLLAFSGGSYSLSEYHYIFPLALFIFIWSSDTGAYCTGCTIGRHKLFPRVSPGKTWEGSVGGAVFALAAAAVISHYDTTLPLWGWMAFALTAVVFGTWGDLVESLLKRHWGIKDSGSILPGHGGMLDRFDSTMLAVPAIIVCLLGIRMWG